MNFQGHLQIGNGLLETGEIDRALAELREAFRLVATSLSACYLCFALAAAGLREEAERMRAEMISTAEQTYIKEYFLAIAHLALGDRDQALNCLEKAAAERDPWLVWFGTEPKLDSLRDDPRFVKIFRSTNNPLALGQLTTLS
jgi:tetratricopeptide (TPR) repeat protein